MIANKKNILALLFLCLCSIVSGTNYYISSSGNDAANGLSETTSWQSISKVNSVFSTFKPGDKILFRKGDTFYGSLNVTASGTSGNPITIGAYGTGNNPVISGFTTLTGWTNQGGGIWSKSISPESNPNILILDGVNTPLGRTPIGTKPAGWPSNTPQGDSFTDGSMYDEALAASPNMVGAEIILRTEYWTVERRKVLSHSGGTVTYGSTSFIPLSGYGYFFQNHISTLNVLGEWCYSGGNIYMYFGSDLPTNHTIKVSTLNTLINNTKSFITIDGLTLEGGNSYCIHLNGASNTTVKNSTIRFGGNNGIYGINAPYTTIEFNIVDNINNYGIFLNHNWVNSCNNSTISNNTVSNIGLILGMGTPENGYSEVNGAYSGVLAESNYTKITYNKIENVGYDGIVCGGQGLRVQYNFIAGTNLNKADGGAIYSYRGSSTDKLIDHNIILNLPTLLYGLTAPLIDGANAIYLDGSCDFTVTNNTIAYVGGKGIFINSNHNNIVENNTFYECLRGIFVFSEPDRRAEENGVDGHARNHVIRYNTVVANTISTDQTVLDIQTRNDESDLSQFGVINYNYYSSPLRTDDYMRRWYEAWNWSPPDTYLKNLNIEEVRSLYGYDKNSTISTRAADANKIRFEYNATNTNKSVALDAGYIDIKGTKYSGNINLLPYTSLILMVDPNPSSTPASPSYVSSSVENAVPSIVEMTYNMTLANIIPAASSFAVRVNSVARVVNTVAISGTKVRLSLASPILYGDVVTVAYSKPSFNPLQTSAGGQAVNLSAQTVTNRVSSIPVTPVNPIYVSSAVENETPNKIDIVFNLALSNVLPAVSTFTVNINSVSRPVSSLAISGSSVILTLGSPVIFGDVITVSYTKPGTNALQSTTGLQVATISAQTVSNKVNSVGPIYVSASVEKVTPNILEITYNENLDNNTIPTTSAFVVMVNGIQRTVTSVVISGKKVLLTLAIPVIYGDIITVSYIKPVTNPLKKSTGEAAGSFSSPQRVTNNTIKKGNVYMFPNPASEYINITVKEPSKEKQIIRILDFSGRLYLETIMDPLVNTIRIPVNLNSGVYIVQVIMGSLTSFTQKIIITN